MNVDWSLLCSVIAMAFILEAMPFILFPERMRQALAELVQGSVMKLRIYGFILLVIGMAVLAVARRGF